MSLLGCLGSFNCWCQKRNHVLPNSRLTYIRCHREHERICLSKLRGKRGSESGVNSLWFVWLVSWLLRCLPLSRVLSIAVRNSRITELVFFAVPRFFSIFFLPFEVRPVSTIPFLVECYVSFYFVPDPLQEMEIIWQARGMWSQSMFLLKSSTFTESRFMCVGVFLWCCWHFYDRFNLWYETYDESQRWVT